MLIRFCFLFFLFCSVIAEAQIYVAVNGSDIAEGTKDKPFASLHMAMRKVRELRRLKDPSVTKGIHVYVGGGNYNLSEPLFIRPEDAGTAKSPTIIESLHGEQAVLSGGIQITGWNKSNLPIKGLPANAGQNIWMANAPETGDVLLDFRQLWVNGEKAIRARDKNRDSMYRIVSWNHKTQQCWIPKPATDISSAKGIEMTILQWWAIANLRVKDLIVQGDSALLSFHQPESRIQSEHPWPAPWISSETGNSAFYLANAIQFLDEPGEWYLDKINRKIYYWPRANEDISTATVIVPALETLVKVKGTTDLPVTNILLKNISFQYTTWMRPSQQGHVPHQLGMYMLDAYKLKQPGTADKKTLENQAWVGRPSASVEISHANNIGFENCRFEHLASTALDFHKAVHHVSAKGNVFNDVGGTAILAGVFSDVANEVHLPYNPKDQREVGNYINISNNLINDVANEDWGCAGIGAGYIKNSSIDHNDISEVPYMGISVGWGWSRTSNAMQNNKVTGNRITRFARQLYDVAGIYTLSSQPGTLISRNYIDSAYKAPYAHLPSHWFYIYTDEGSSYIIIKDNWTPSQKFLQNANGPGNQWINNGPMVSEQIKRDAGLQTNYRHLLKEKKILFETQPIVHEQPVIIELVSNTNINLDKLKVVLLQNNVRENSLYAWQNHYVIYGKVKDVSVLRGKLQSAFPQSQLKVYYDPFYEFNRQRCDDRTTSKKWDHYILTANLVADPKLQKEYLDHHSTQFEKWPEVSEGFCKADFQQLLIYKNGRQLMLVIRIPEGASLDQLNPKTTKDNPKMGEWNSIMKKYQEGIEGTRPGETWIFLKKL